MTTELSDLTASQLIELYRSGGASPVDAVESCLRRMDEVDPAVNAINGQVAESAMAAARRSAERLARGQAGLLEGVPFGLKDIIATQGVLTSGGSRLYGDHVPDHDAALAERLVGAGGVLAAKLHTFEFACGGADNQAYGVCRNPWDLERTTGGSSSGSGAAVAAREVPLAIGTDTAGSIRIPSAYCGITGLKPTFGRVPRHGVMGLSWSLDHAGPMARSVEDCALMLQAIAGHDPRDPTSSTRAVPDYSDGLHRSVRGLRLARPAGWLEERMHPEVAAAYEESLEVLRSLGAEIVSCELPSIELVEVAGWSVLYAEMLSLHDCHWSTLEDRDSMGRGLLAATPFVAASDYLRSLRFRSAFQDEFEAALQGCAAMVVPGSFSIAPRLDDMLADLGDEQVDWLSIATRTHLPFNMTGSPGLCLPAGLVQGMPVSLQLVGRPHDEQVLFALGAAFQRETDHHRLAPQLRSGAAVAANGAPVGVGAA